MSKSNRRERQAFNASAWEGGSGGVRVANVAFGQDNPQGRIEDAFRKARYWWTYNQFVRRMTTLRTAFYNYGCEVVPVEQTKSAKAAVKKWLDGMDPTRKDPRRGGPKRRIAEFVRDVWREWLLMDNVITVWRTAGGRPVVYAPEDCDCSDVFGIEKLILTPHFNLVINETMAPPGPVAVVGPVLS